MWKFAVSIYVYKIKIPICVILPGTVFLVTGLSASFSNNQQFLDALPSSMGASSTGFSFDREVITPTDCDQETPSFLLMNCCTWCLFSTEHLLKLYLHQWYWEEHRQFYCLHLCSIIIFLETEGATHLLKADDTWESNSCKLDLQRHQGTRKKNLYKKPNKYFCTLLHQ